MADAFLSYSSRDREIAAIIAHQLEKAGISVWWDRRLVGGDEFRNEILTQLRASRYVVVIWTANSVRSQWVADEADEAKSVRRLIPMVHAGTERSDVPLGFRDLHMISAGDTESLIAAMKGKLDAEDIATLCAKQKPGALRNVLRNPLLYVALSGALLLYIVFPGFLLGILIGICFVLFLLVWISS